jgi:hypothetical protein
MSHTSERPTYRPAAAPVPGEDADLEAFDRPTLPNFIAPCVPSEDEESNRPEAFNALAGVISKAALVGNVSAVALTVSPRFDQLAEACEAGRPVAEETVAVAVRSAVQIASATRQGFWVNVALRICHARSKTLPHDLIDTLYTVIRQTEGVDWPLLARYADLLGNDADRMHPAERFAAKRIEGLLSLSSR